VSYTVELSPALSKSRFSQDVIFWGWIVQYNGKTIRSGREFKKRKAKIAAMSAIIGHSKMRKATDAAASYLS
jgi:hypothetical protein